MAAQKLQKIKFHARIAWRFASTYPIQCEFFALLENANRSARAWVLVALSTIVLAGVCWAFWGENVAAALTDWRSPRAWLGMGALAAIFFMLMLGEPIGNVLEDEDHKASVELPALAAYPVALVFVCLWETFDSWGRKLEDLAEKPESWGGRLACCGWAFAIIAAIGVLGAVAGLMIVASVLAAAFLFVAPVSISKWASGQLTPSELAFYRENWMAGIVVIAWIRHAPWRRWGGAAWTAMLSARAAKFDKGDMRRGKGGWATRKLARSIVDNARSMLKWPSLLSIFQWADREKAKAIGISFALVGGALYIAAARFPAMVGQLGLSLSAEEWAKPSAWAKLAIYATLLGLMLRSSEWMGEQMAEDEPLRAQMMDALIAPIASLAEPAGRLCEKIWSNAWQDLSPRSGFVAKFRSAALLVVAAILCGVLACISVGAALLAIGAALACLASPLLVIVWALGGKMPELAPLAKEYWGLGVVALVWLRHMPWGRWGRGAKERARHCRRRMGVALNHMKESASTWLKESKPALSSGQAWSKMASAPARWIAAMSQSLEERGIFSDIERDFLGGGAKPKVMEKKRTRL